MLIKFYFNSTLLIFLFLISSEKNLCVFLLIFYICVQLQVTGKKGIKRHESTKKYHYQENWRSLLIYKAHLSNGIRALETSF